MRTCKSVYKFNTQNVILFFFVFDIIRVILVLIIMKMYSLVDIY